MRWTLPLALIAATLLPTPVEAWEPATRVRMVDEAVRFMPASLRKALEHHREHLRRGLLTPMTEEGQADHLPPWTDGFLDRRIAGEAQGLVGALQEQTPFSELARRFGAVAHYTLDAGFPPGMTDSDGDDRYVHFARFCESRREKFPLVFYGHHDLDGVAKMDFGRFGLEIMQRARDEDGELARAYAAAGDPPNPAAFDDRSVPFAVGSLAYSHSVTDIVRVWLQIWKQGSGDMGRTPYRKKKKTTKKKTSGS